MAVYPCPRQRPGGPGGDEDGARCGDEKRRGCERHEGVERTQGPGLQVRGHEELREGGAGTGSGDSYARGEEKASDHGGYGCEDHGVTGGQAEGGTGYEDG